MAMRHEMPGLGAAATAGVAALVAAAALVLTLAGHGAFSTASPAPAIAPPIPGLTLDETNLDRGPVVTSLRTHSEAERRGVRVGDRIDAVDGRPVRDLAALRAAMAKHSGPVPVSLQIQRGDAIWDVALDRAEPSDDGSNMQAARDEPEDPARRGR